MNRVFSIFLIFTTTLMSQKLSVEDIRNNVFSQFSQINDYQVDMKISVKMTGFRMPNKKVRIYYKKPNKMKAETKGFALLPTTGVNGNPSEFFDMLKHVNDIKRIIYNDEPYFKITGKVNRDSLKIPLKLNKNEIPDITMDVFIDAKKWVITEVGVFLNAENIFSFNTDYTELEGIYVPEKSTFKIGIKGISRWSTANPVDMGGPGSERQDFETIAKNAGFDPNKDEFVGEMIMTFTNYKVNKGIEDKIFQKE